MANDLKWLTQLKKGLLELCCLNLLSRQEYYGYELARTLSEIPGLSVSLGTVYPLLSRLKQEGLVNSTLEESPQGPARRRYALTETGREHLQKMNEHWNEITAHVNILISS